MPSEPDFDLGLLTPVSTGADDAVSDAAVLAALVTAEVALVRAWGGGSADEVSRTFGWTAPGESVSDPRVDPRALAIASVPGGNPVIPLVAALRELLHDRDRAAVHRGATSQDILDSALMLLARRTAGLICDDLRQTEHALAVLAAAHRDTIAAARTLTQHAVPTTVGARIAAWVRSIRRARLGLQTSASHLPAQLGGAGGTLASFVALSDEPTAARLPGAFAAELGLAAPDAPWHTERWPVTELGDTLVRTTDALGVFAADVANGARTEIGEWVVSAVGGSSAMPQKRNPTPAVLVRSAAIRAPHLGATLHAAAASAVDERPDGAWHAEWPALRDLLRLVLGAASTARGLAESLAVDADAVRRNLELTGGRLVAERLSLELGPIVGVDVITDLLRRANAGRDLGGMLRCELGDDVGDETLAALLDPARYTGLAGRLVDGLGECQA